MAKILNSEITFRSLNNLKLENPNEVPQEISEKIVPVYNVNEIGRLITISDNVSTNTKIYTVPTGKRWKILWANFTYTCTATVGNRAIGFGSYQSTVVYDIRASANLTASQAQKFIVTAGTGYPIAVSSAGSITRNYLPIPSSFILNAGETLRILDTANIDVADTLNIYISYLEYSDTAVIL